MTNNELIKLLETTLFDLDIKAYDRAKNTLESLLQLLKCQSELNSFRKIVYDKMLFYHTRDKAKNKALYDLYQELKKLSNDSFDFGKYYLQYLELLK